MELRKYQKIAVDKLVSISKKLLAKEGPRICVFKAPTGSGKTIMVADLLEQLSREQLPSHYAFVWISGNKLHEQSREKLEDYLKTSRYTFSYIEDVQNNSFKENEIVFVNWHSLTKQDHKTGAYTNIFMRDNEGDKNLRSFITNTKENGLQIILIVDESHYHYWSTQSQQLVQDVITPKLTLEVSATPKLEPSNEDVVNEDAGFVSVKFEDVIAEGMIKTEVIINKEIGKYTEFQKVADEAIISASLQKQEELIGLYKKIDSPINPLILIQLPNESEEISSLDKTKLEFVENFLREKYNITRQNGLLGVWLSGDNTIDKHQIVKNDDKTRVLIFKQAIALGWDCPRAQILIMFREIQSVIFEIQTVGRILRMAEIKHYENDELNRAFVYTNLPKLQVAQDKESQSFFHINPAHRITDYTKVMLPSVYLSRIDYGDLTLRFRKLFIEEANRYFGITENDMPTIAKNKADKKLDLLPSELTEPIISDVVLRGIEDVVGTVGKIVKFSVSEDDLKFKFEFFAKALSLPYAPSRSHTKIQQSIYDWFDNYLGYKNISRLEIQRIVVCSENNQKIFREIIETAKEKFHEVNKQDKQSKQSRKLSTWEVPPIDYFNELYEKTNESRYAMTPCYLQIDRSQPEKDFENKIEQNKNVKWWYKNGSGGETYLAVAYIDPQEKVERAFYPDYIVCFKSNTVGIYDTKSGFTAEIKETEAKSNALQTYIKTLKAKGRKTVGGIVVSKQSGLFLFDGQQYTADQSNKNWHRLEL